MKYTTIGEVKKEIFTCYKERGYKVSFIDALLAIEKKNYYVEKKNIYQKLAVHWNDETFEEYVASLPIYMDNILASSSYSDCGKILPGYQ